VGRLEFPEDLRQEEVGDRRARADQERAGDLAAQVPQARIELRRQRQDPLGIRERDRSRGREADAAMGAVEQPGVELVFQLADLERHRRLRHAERFPRLGEREVLRDRVEYLKPPIRHRPVPGSRRLFKHKNPGAALRRDPRFRNREDDRGRSVGARNAPARPGPA
jgi:hypothetical protein